MRCVRESPADGSGRPPLKVTVLSVRGREVAIQLMGDPYWDRGKVSSSALHNLPLSTKLHPKMYIHI
ncbi:hypothetical protein V3C99_006062 [Haemonchus contortus]